MKKRDNHLDPEGSYALVPDVPEGGDEVELDVVKYSEVRDEFDPSNGTVSRGVVTCPRCGTRIRREQVHALVGSSRVSRRGSCPFARVLSGGRGGFGGGSGSIGRLPIRIGSILDGRGRSCSSRGGVGRGGLGPY